MKYLHISIKILRFSPICLSGLLHLSRQLSHKTKCTAPLQASSNIWAAFLAFWPACLFIVCQKFVDLLATGCRFLGQFTSELLTPGVPDYARPVCFHYNSYSVPGGGGRALNKINKVSTILTWIWSRIDMEDPEGILFWAFWGHSCGINRNACYHSCTYLLTIASTYFKLNPNSNSVGRQHFKFAAADRGRVRGGLLEQHRIMSFSLSPPIFMASALRGEGGVRFALLCTVNGEIQIRFWLGLVVVEKRNISTSVKLDLNSEVMLARNNGRFLLPISWNALRYRKIVGDNILFFSSTFSLLHAASSRSAVQMEIISRRAARGKLFSKCTPSQTPTSNSTLVFTSGVG